jgi:hypothetical protein
MKGAASIRLESSRARRCIKPQPAASNKDTQCHRWVLWEASDVSVA